MFKYSKKYKHVKYEMPILSENKSESTKRCTCVPSGMCHSHTILGCPHSHYFDEKGVWRCVIYEEKIKQNR